MRFHPVDIVVTILLLAFLLPVCLIYDIITMFLRACRMGPTAKRTCLASLITFLCSVCVCTWTFYPTLQYVVVERAAVSIEYVSIAFKDDILGLCWGLWQSLVCTSRLAFRLFTKVFSYLLAYCPLVCSLFLCLFLCHYLYLSVCVWLFQSK